MIKYMILGNEMTRDNNKKVIDDKPLKIFKWQDSNFKQCDNLTLLPDKVVAIHTGKSNILVLDFDDNTFNLALELNEELNTEAQCKYISKSINKDGGHFIYKYSDNNLTKFINNPNGKKQNKIDTLYGNTLVFGSNSPNKTKKVLLQNKELNEIPIAMQQFIISKYNSNSNNIKQEYLYTHNVKLGSLVTQAMTSEPHLISLLNIITNKQYKAQMNNSRKKLFKYHPDRLETDCHLYLVSLSGVFMLDDSISKDLHTKIMVYINSLFSEPLDTKRLNSILKHDFNSDKYRYDPKWKSKSLILTNKKSEPLEIFMFTEKKTINYLVYNHVTKEVNIYLASISVIDFISSETGSKLDKAKLARSAIHVSIINTPDENFGQNYINKTFNCYIRNEEQNIFYNPIEYRNLWSYEHKKIDYNKDHPLYPTTTLKALEAAIGEDKLYSLFLPFMKRKYITRDYSPLFFVFFGVPHSFKSAIVNGVFNKLSKDRYITIKLDNIQDRYNDWLLDKDIILLEEIHHLPSFEVNKLVKFINEISGSETINGIRRMYQSIDNKVYKQEITFMLTTNQTVRLTSEAKDRRMVVFTNLKPISQLLNISNTEIENNIKEESKNFAYYLATEVDSLEGDDYISNYAWRDEDYKLFQENALSYEDRLIKAIDSNDIITFNSLLIELGLDEKEIFQSFYSLTKRPGYKFRLYNTRPDVAKVVGVFNLLNNIDMNKLKKGMQLISHLTCNANEYENSKITGSRKYEWSMEENKVPNNVLKFVNKIDEIVDKEVL